VLFSYYNNKGIAEAERQNSVRQAENGRQTASDNRTGLRGQSPTHSFFWQRRENKILVGGLSLQAVNRPTTATAKRYSRQPRTHVSIVTSHGYLRHESAETYLGALRRVVEDKLGVSLQSYLEAGEGEDLEEEDVAERS